MDNKTFIIILWAHFFNDKPLQPKELLRYAHFRGWIEDQDERFCDNILTRQTAARIIHQFMKIELGLSDIKDISPANKIADLYNCHTCVNHIAQVYLRGIIQTQTVERDGIKVEVFNHLDNVTEEEAIQIIARIVDCFSFASQ